MAGMNRLGAGPKRPPAVVRPVDPNRHKTIEIQPEGVEGDLEYQRLVQEVEDGVGARQAGWLFGRGAFDKTDLQYLKDVEDKKKYAELEQVEQEKATFAQLRSKYDSLEGSSAGDAVQELIEQSRRAKKEQISGSFAVRDTAERHHVRDGRRKQSQVLARMVKVKRAAPSEEDKTAGATGDDAKRPKTGKQANGTSNVEDKEDVGGLPGLLGDYGSGSESDPSEP